MNFIDKAFIGAILLLLLGGFIAVGFVIGFGRGYSRALCDVVEYLDNGQPAEKVFI